MVRSCAVKATKQMRKRSNKLRAIFASCLMLATSTAANAAQMEVRRYDRLPVVFFHGNIETGDEKKFFALANRLPSKSVIMLRSDGGLIYPALVMGEMIRSKRFTTAVAGTCASACGLMWLAGTNRILFKNDSKVGFHAAFDPKNGHEHGATNAIVGAYLTRLGFKYDAVDYFTKAGPTEMEWLDDAAAKQYGIKVTVLSSPYSNATLDKQTSPGR
jgi:hypothetical protein